jgi:hypothetical protein
MVATVVAVVAALRNLAAPSGAVGARHWRFQLITNVGVLTAHCTPAQGIGLGGGAITARRVRAACAARLVPAG